MKHARADYEHIQDPSGKIPDDEPVFLLRAQDQLAASLVTEWAERLRADGGDPEMIELARAHANRMAEWPHKKRPDLPCVANIRSVG